MQHLSFGTTRWKSRRRLATVRSSGLHMDEEAEGLLRTGCAIVARATAHELRGNIHIFFISYAVSAEFFLHTHTCYMTNRSDRIVQAEFRLYWIDSKLGETEELGERDTERNAHPILPLPRISCNSDLSAALMDLPPELLPLDGLLFYHRNAQYNFGRTPLVTWLKPFMLPEVLGVSVPPPLDERPDDYVNFEHYINSTTKSGRSSKKVVENFVSFFSRCTMRIIRNMQGV